MVDGQPIMRSALRGALRRYLEAKGVDAEALAVAVGISMTDGADPLSPIPLNAMLTLFERVAQELEDPCFGVAFAHALRPGETGLIGELILASPTVRDALKSAAMHVGAFMSPMEIDFFEAEGVGGLKWTYPATVTAPHQQYNTFICRLLALRIGKSADQDWAPLLVQMDHPAPAGSEDRIRAELGSRVRFNASDNRIIVDATTLSRQMPSANEVRYAIARDLATRVTAEAERRPQIISDARDVIGQLLPTGQPELDMVAGRMGITAGALQWRLERAGTSFEKVLSDVRRARAEYLLANTNKPLTDIAYELGFSEPSAFSRAARRWFGMSPSAFRRHQRGS